ncbi:MAG: hypothetical protein PHG16_11635 [Lachnospiraceae bacterium]|nr:hypothetical protein [Lachnospiraceae bacterium]
MFGKHEDDDREYDEDLEYEEDEDLEYEDDREDDYLNSEEEDDEEDAYLKRTSFVVGKLLPGLIGIMVIILIGCLSYQFVLKDKLSTLFAGKGSAQTASVTVAPTQAVTPTPVATQTPAASTPTAVPTAAVQDTSANQEQETENSAFAEVEDVVTAKDSVNLRSDPSNGDDSNIVGILYNGTKADRTGTSDNGWSRLDYDGTTCYAVTSYLTTELDAANIALEDDGIQTQFEDWKDEVTAKEEVNLRTMPSVTNPDSEVVATISYGEIVSRTGINTELGWSRVEYQGQTLYCISSYVMNP